MRLPDLLLERGVDPGVFLKKVASYWDGESEMRVGDPGALIRSYVDRALDWDSQPEGWDFWMDLHYKWRAADSRDRWPALEVAMRLLDPLEAELLEVGDGVT